VSGVSNAAWRFFSFPDATDAFVSIAMGVIIGVTVGFFHDRLESVPRSLPFIHVMVQFAAYAGVRLALKRLSAAYGRTATVRPTVITHPHFRLADGGAALDFRVPLPGTPISESMYSWIVVICSG
jgi:FlaA1/EpsC-like NDP-sugar epimerase